MMESGVAHILSPLSQTKMRFILPKQKQEESLL